MYIGHHSPLYHVLPPGIVISFPSLVSLIETIAKALSDDGKLERIKEILKQIVMNSFIFFLKQFLNIGRIILCRSAPFSLDKFKQDFYVN